MNKKNIKISIITPSFNSGKFIERAIKSVLKQDYKNWEHIIVDGISSDDTLKILGKYKHLKWISEKDSGQADAMNKGFDLSSGDVIVYLNADDYFLPGAFSSVIKQFEQGAKFVVGNIMVKSKRLGTNFINIPSVDKNKILRHWEPNAFPHNPVGYFYLREVQENCPFNINNYATMDLEFLVDASNKFNFTKIDKILGCFEDGDDTKTGKTQSRLDYWQNSNFSYINKYLDLLPYNDKKRYENDRMGGYINMQAHMNKINKEKFALLSIDNMPMVSIIIPSYNCSEYISRSVDSVLEQNLKNFEIIIVDDASTDDTPTILKKYKNISNIKIIRNKLNQKQAASRNIGLDLAVGKYIFFLDADDWIENGCLAHLISIAEIYNVEIVGCGIKRSENKKISYPYHSFAFSCLGGLEGLKYFSNNFIGSVVWNKLYLRDFIEKNNLRFTPKYWHEDVMFTVRSIFLCEKYIQISNEYYDYFCKNNHSTTMMIPTQLHLESYINLYVEMLSFIKYYNINEDKDGKALCRELLKNHCYDPNFQKVLHYIETRSGDEWENECFNAFYNVLGINGYGIASLIVESMKLINRIHTGNGIKGLKNFCNEVTINEKIRFSDINEKIFTVNNFKKAIFVLKNEGAKSLIYKIKRSFFKKII